MMDEHFSNHRPAQILLNFEATIMDDLGPSVNITRGNMGPRNSNAGTNAGNSLGQERVGLEHLQTLKLVGISIEFLGRIGGVDNKIRLHLAHVIEQELEASIIEGVPR